MKWHSMAQLMGHSECPEGNGCSWPVRFIISSSMACFSPINCRFQTSVLSHSADHISVSQDGPHVALLWYLCFLTADSFCFLSTSHTFPCPSWLLALLPKACKCEYSRLQIRRKPTWVCYLAESIRFQLYYTDMRDVR